MKSLGFRGLVENGVKAWGCISLGSAQLCLLIHENQTANVHLHRHQILHLQQNMQNDEKHTEP